MGFARRVLEPLFPRCEKGSGQAVLPKGWTGFSLRTRWTVAVEMRWPLAIWPRLWPLPRSRWMVALSSTTGFRPICWPSSRVPECRPALVRATLISPLVQDTGQAKCTSGVHGFAYQALALIESDSGYSEDKYTYRTDGINR